MKPKKNSIRVNNIKTNNEKIDEEIFKNIKNKFEDYKELFIDTFLSDLASIMSRYFLPVYLSSLIVVFSFSVMSLLISSLKISSS